MEDTSFELGKAFAPLLVGVIGYLIGSRIYKNKIKKVEEENEV